MHLTNLQLVILLFVVAYVVGRRHGKAVRK